MAHAFSVPAGLLSPADPELTCVESLTLPTTGILAARASGSGTVKAIARIGAAGQLASLHLDGGDATLKWDVTAALEVSRFKPRCAGGKVAFDFAFTLLEDNPTGYIAAPLVRFVPPNRFELTFRRVKGNIDMPPGKEPAKVAK